VPGASVAEQKAPGTRSFIMPKKIDVEYVANLARIRLSEKDLKNFQGQFKDILSYIEKLNKLDTSKVPPTSHILPVKNVFRKDIVRPSLPPEKALANAPAKKNNLFKMPKIVEGA